LREIIERISLEDSFIIMYFPQTEIKPHLSVKQIEYENFETHSHLQNLDQLTLENFSKSTLDHTHENIFYEEELEAEYSVCQSTIRNKDDRFFMEKILLFWKEHLPAQKRI
jgi:hypothetical protein